MHIWEVIREIENKKIGARELSVKKKQITSYLALLLLLFIAGLAFGCVSQIVSFDLKFNYVDTINRIRNSIEK